MSQQNHRGGEGYDPGAELTEDADIGDFLDAVVDEGKAYYAAQKDYLTLSAHQQVGKAAGSFYGVLLSGVSILMFLLFVSLALAFWLGSLLDSVMLGFLCVGGIYLLIFLILHFIARDSIRNSFMLNVINSFYDEKD